MRDKILFFSLLLFIQPTFADAIHIESGIRKNTLIELYTSEGCSSCPPAEEYLNHYVDNPQLWKTWIPVAFHVDYWDYIGWKDRYAKKEYGARQSRYAKLKQVSTVYTPAFMVNGQSWRPGFFSPSLKEETSEVGNLAVTMTGNNITASFKPVNKIDGTLTLNIALLGMDLATKIERGENAGRNAKHEFVVIGFNKKQSHNNQWQMTLPKEHYQGAKHYALAAWVSVDNNPTPIQALGTYLPALKLY